jgi:hypothetical protein
MIPHRGLSRDTNENGVSSRVDACRKRLRLIRANQRGPIETGLLVSCDVESSSEVSRIPRTMETVERMDEDGIT